ncbi:MAG: hypothetical protein WDM78_20855 [Puia sp.]
MKRSWVSSWIGEISEKKFFSMDVLEDTQELEYDVPHRPGKLYKFNYQKYKTKEGRKFMRLDF